MIDTFVLMMVGHFVGDYLLQNQWMAVGKSQRGWRGHLACTVHVALYTAAVCALSGVWNPLAVASIAVPHWIIDRWSLATYWLKAKNGYDLHGVWKKAPLCAQPAPGELEQNVWKVAFAAPVYIANDNTMHFLCLLATAKWLA